MFSNKSQSFASVLAILNIRAHAAKGAVYSFHLTLVSLTICALYVYRDVWPLMTFTLRPLDEAEGSILWVKVALIIYIAVVAPLCEPYPYIPVDAGEPMPVPNPEQTASIISFLFYTFLDPTIWLAWRIPHLSRDQLPPLCDYDYVKSLVARSYPVSKLPLRSIGCTHSPSNFDS